MNAFPLHRPNSRAHAIPSRSTTRSRSGGWTPQSSSNSSRGITSAGGPCAMISPVAQQHDAIALAQFLGLVLDHDQAEALSRIGESARRLPPCPRDPDRWSAHRGRPRAGLSASTEAIARRCFSPPESDGRIAMVEAAQSDCVERGPDARDDLLARHPDLFHREGHLMRDGGREKLRFEILKHHPDIGARSHTRSPSRARPPMRTMPLKSPSSKLGHDAIEAFRQGRFAGARRPHDADHLAGAWTSNRTPRSAAPSPPA